MLGRLICYICSPRKRIFNLKERCLSGRKEQFAKLSYWQRYRGFESLSLRKYFKNKALNIVLRAFLLLKIKRVSQRVSHFRLLRASISTIFVYPFVVIRIKSKGMRFYYCIPFFLAKSAFKCSIRQPCASTSERKFIASSTL